MKDLFTQTPPPPLAEAMRPDSIDQVVGQAHLLGEGRPLQLAFAAKKPHSMVFWGPPGVGKTTLAKLTAKAFDCHFIALSAVFAGVKEVRVAIQEAEYHLQNGTHTLLFIDEIHRFNKSQQDALLPFIESGLITFIGATTENPSFELNRALLSRAQVYVLEELNSDDLKQLIQKAQRLSLFNLTLSDTATEQLVHLANGDARRLFNLLEQCSNAAQASGSQEIDGEFLQVALSVNAKRFDKGGDTFYDQISALHKSVRGSNPDAALYWFSRMMNGGADPLYLARRILRIAWEDIGLADPRAIQIANDAAQTYERLGSPEGELALAQAVLYLSVAAKSNAGYVAFKQAKAFVAQDKSRPVPLHLRNAVTNLMKNQGFGKDYRYAHDEEDAYAAGENYFPEHLDNPRWYRPVPRGLEIQIREKLASLREKDARAYDASKADKTHE